MAPRPVLVGCEGENVIVLILAHKMAAGGVNIPRLLLCRVAPDGQPTWTEVDDSGVSDLTSQVATLGWTSAARLGGRVYVVAGHRLAVVDLAAGTLTSAVAINDSLMGLVSNLAVSGRVYLYVGAWGPYLIVDAGAGGDGRYVLAFVGDRLAGQLRVTNEGVRPINSSGEAGQLLPWPWKSDAQPMLIFPGT